MYGSMYSFTRCHVFNISSWWDPLIGQIVAISASDWPDVSECPGDMSGTQVSSTSHVHNPGPCYNQSGIMSCQLWPIRDQYWLNLTNQRPVSPVHSRQTFPFLWPNDRGDTPTRQNIEMSDWLSGSNRNIIETPMVYEMFVFFKQKTKYFRLCLSYKVSKVSFLQSTK